MKIATALALALASLALLAGCPDNTSKAGSTPTAASGTTPAAASGAASAAASAKGGSGW